MTTATITASSNIDVAGIVSALMDVERQPLQRLETKAEGLRSTISEFGRLQSSMDALSAAADALTEAKTWGAATGVSSDDTAVGIKAASGALMGNYAVKVNQLASPQTIVSGALDDKNSVIGGGSLTIQFAADEDGVVPDPFTIDIEAGATLEEVSAAINAGNHGIGASLVTDAGGTRIMLRSSESGEAQAFQVTATADGTGVGASLADLSYTPGQAGGTMQATQTASNAKFELNGLALESASNEPEGVLENISLTLRKVTASPVDLEVQTDSESIREKLDTFITAYNATNSLIREQTSYNAETQTAGALQGNRMAIMAQSRLREIVSGTLSGAEGEDAPALSRLHDIGIDIAQDGSLSLDASKFEVASASRSDITRLFAGNGLDGSSKGFASQLTDIIENLLGTDGAISGATESLRAREQDIEDQQSAWEVRLESIEARLLRQYTTLDANMAVMQSALSQVSTLG